MTVSPAQFNDKTTASEAAETFASNIKGRVVLLTGVTQGSLGAEVARAIAKEGPALLVLAGRREKAIEDTKAAILAESQAANLRSLVLDLDSFAAVRAAAAEVLKYSESIDVLINNAGTIVFTSTAEPTFIDGIEKTLVVNHLSPFLFTNLVRPKISSTGRVVNVSSEAHHFSPIVFDDYNLNKNGPFNEMVAYGQSKTANILFTQSLVERWGIEALTLHPGIIATNLPGSATKEEMIKMGLLTPEGEVAPWPRKTVPEGAATTVIAAFNPALKDHNGAYLIDGQVTKDHAEAYATDKEAAEKLWKLSEKLVGEKF